MTRGIGGTAAKSGFYWNLGKWEMTMVPKQGGILPGGATDRYLRVPVLALLVVAPLMGAVYAMFLPFIGFAMVFTFLGKKALALGRSGAVDVAATMTPDWRPGEAYLASSRKAVPDPENGEDVNPGEIEVAPGPQHPAARRDDLHD